MENLEIERLSKYLQNKHKIYYSAQTSMGIILTDKCPAGCRHCISDNSLSPSIPIPKKLLLERVDKTSELNLFEKVIITGGEPFYELKKLLELVRHISECKLKPSVVTGAWWASSLEKCRRVLAALKKAGLYSIALSADRYHQEKIPITNLANALNATNELELQYTLVLTGTSDREKDKQYEDKLKDVICGPTDSKLRISRGSMLNSGRALKNQLINKRQEEDQYDPVICQSMGKIIRSDGLIALCCGADLPIDSPLLAGNIDELSVSVIKKSSGKIF